MTMLKEWLGFLREQFPEGSRIRLRKHGDDALEPGIIGILNRITDDAGFCVTWENGQHTELKLGTDSFSVLPAEFQTLKLYMPLTAEIYDRNERGDLDENPTDAGGRHLVKYENIIAAALRENYMPEEQERGIMHWYEEDTPLDIKVHSIFFGVEKRGNCLWGVAECRVAGSLSPLELAELKQYVTSHASDNWGGIFAQRNIQLDDGEMNVYLWNSENWSIQTEQERFAPEQVQPEQQPNEPQGNNRGYTVNGLLAEMEPRYSAYRKIIRECIAGLTGHAAQLAAHGDEEQLPMFRKSLFKIF